jgi:hypothetical protein
MTSLTDLCNTFLVGSHTTTTRLPLVGYGGSLLVEPRKNGQEGRGINRVPPPARPQLTARSRPTPPATAAAIAGTATRQTQNALWSWVAS